MASTRSALLLLFLAAGAYAVDASVRTTIGWNTINMSKDQNDASSRVRIPSALSAQMSPLDAGAASSYAIKLADGSIVQHGKEFCSDAKLVCDSNMEILDPSLEISLDRLTDSNLLEKTRNMVAALRAMYFGEKELIPGNKIVVPARSLRDGQFRTASFLPSSLAKLMPFSSARMPELLQKLNIPQNSNLAVMMSRTMAQCEAHETMTTTLAAKDSHKCMTSLEDMTNFVAARLPRDATISTLDRTISASDLPVNAQDNSFKVLEAKAYERSVVCHKSMFPFAVYQCHDITKDGMKVYAVAMESRDGRRINQIASCNVNDGTTNQILKSKPLGSNNEDQACHWVSDAFVWAPTN